ncbi:MAG: putative peptidase YuxL [Herpetosiphonaceae bacterium]|nr:MAG: putative peptidase YuxL [Herpetosiphonaceae bacterium]
MKRSFTPETLLELRFVSDAQVAPDGRRVAFVESWIEEVEKDGQKRLDYRSAIYLIEEPGARPKRLTYGHQGRDTTPRWSPDGTRLAFLSTRGGEKAQIYLLELNGGEARRLTGFSSGVKELAWRPDGQAIAFVSRGHRSKNEREIEKLRDELITERLPFKFDNIGLLPDERAHIWLLELDGESEPRRLTSTDRDHYAISWAPDCTAIAWISAPTPDLEDSGISDLFVLELETGEERMLTRSQGPLYHSGWRPDSKRLAFIGHDNRLGMGTNEAIWVVWRHGGTPRNLCSDRAGFDYPVGNSVLSDSRYGSFPQDPLWEPDGTIYICATAHGRTHIYGVPKPGQPLVRLTEEDGPSVSGYTRAQGVTVYTASTPTQTESIYMREPGGATRLLYRSNAELLDSLEMVTPERVAFKGAGDLPLEGWVMQPLHARKGERYPLILSIHGGPHGAYGYGFFHEFQILAAAGFGILYINPRGSTGYGENFRAMVRRNFGDKDYEDLMAAVDQAVTWDWVDPKRLGVMGGSYGGYMTNWITCHTDRFAAAVTLRCLSNLISFYGASDIGPRFSEDEFRRQSLGASGDLPAPLADLLRSQRENANVGHPFRARPPLPNRSGRDMVHRAQAPWGPNALHSFPSRKPRAFAEWRADSPRQSAGVHPRLVWTLPPGQTACKRRRAEPPASGNAAAAIKY